jgi:hypothetical protein
MGASQEELARPSASPGSAAPAGVALATEHPFLSTADLALRIHERLADDQQALMLELAASDFDLAAVVSTVRRLNATARIGGDFATALSRIPGSRAVGLELVVFYQSVVEAADEALSESVNDRVGFRAAAKRLLAALEPMASLQKRLEALIQSARATPGVAGAIATPVSTDPATPDPATPVPATPVPATPVPATPVPTATPAPTPSSTAPAQTGRPSIPPQPSVLPLVGQIQNPGFEAIDPKPWVLALESPAAATLTVDAAAAPFEGARSARIDIAASSDARTGVALRQTGIDVAASRRYVCRVALRAAADREVRVRVTSASGATYGTRLVTVGPVWTVVEFEFGSFVQDPAAVVNIDLGRSAITTWVDAVQITDGSVSVP